MNRDKYPEKVPFRLTRMLVKAMEVSGIEGSYRSTCERTMTVLRESRDSLVAMLEAFVYDPLISWRLVDLSNNADAGISLGADEIRAVSSKTLSSNPLEGASVMSGVPIDLASGRSTLLNDPITEADDEDGEDERRDVLLPESVHEMPGSTSHRRPAPAHEQRAMSATQARSIKMYKNMQTWAANLSTDSRIASVTGGERSEQVAVEGSIARSRIERSVRQRELMTLLDGDGGAAHEEALNEKALKVIRRVQDKLQGTDFPDCHDDPLDVDHQVQRLVVQATSTENLCQLFIGWCAFW